MYESTSSNILKPGVSSCINYMSAPQPNSSIPDPSTNNLHPTRSHQAPPGSHLTGRTFRGQRRAVGCGPGEGAPRATGLRLPRRAWEAQRLHCEPHPNGRMASWREGQPLFFMIVFSYSYIWKITKMKVSMGRLSVNGLSGWWFIYLPL